MEAYTDFSEIQQNLASDNVTEQIIWLYCFIDEFIYFFQTLLLPYAIKPISWIPPTKKFSIWLSPMVTLALFFPFSWHKTYKSYHQFLMTYHICDFPKLPSYTAFVIWIKKVAPLCVLVLQMITTFFRWNTPETAIKFADSTRLKVCENQRIQEHTINLQTY